MDNQGKKSYIVEVKFSTKMVYFVGSIVLGGITVISIMESFWAEGIIELILCFSVAVSFMIAFLLLVKSTTQITVNPENKTIVKKRFLTKTYSYKCIKYILRSSFDIVKVYTDKGFLFQYDQSYTNYEKIDRMMKQKIQQKSIIEVKSKRELKKLMKEAKRKD